MATRLDTCNVRVMPTFTETGCHHFLVSGSS